MIFSLKPLSFTTSPHQKPSENDSIRGQCFSKLYLSERGTIIGAKHFASGFVGLTSGDQLLVTLLQVHKQSGIVLDQVPIKALVQVPRGHLFK